MKQLIITVDFGDGEEGKIQRIAWAVQGLIDKIMGRVCTNFTVPHGFKWNQSFEDKRFSTDRIKSVIEKL